MYNQIMDAEHAVMLHGGFLNVPDQGRVRCFAEQGADGFAHQTDAGPDDE